jgi:hypothetical protein
MMPDPGRTCEAAGFILRASIDESQMRYGPGQLPRGPVLAENMQ